MDTIYIAYGFHVENGQASAINMRQFTNRQQAERQYHLYCAAAAISEYPVDTAVLMTQDAFVLETKTWHHETAAPAENAE